MSASDLCVANTAKRIQKVIRDLCEKLSISFVLSEKSSEVQLTRLDSSINIPAFQLPSQNPPEIHSKILSEIKDELNNTIAEIKTELKDTKDSIIEQAEENIFQNEVIFVFGYSETLIKFFSVPY
jgi:translation initiation factor 2B subunit (eIF-2B alpha/beta/delta family)